MSQRITYVLMNANRCGGVRVVLEHVSRLRQRGLDAQVFHVFDDTSWFEDPNLPAIRFGNVQSLKSALVAEKGIKVATWFETAYWVKECLNPGDRGYYLVQDIEDSYCSLPEHKKYALATYELGLTHLVTSKWVRKRLTDELHQSSILIGIGVDFDKFYPLPPDTFFRDRWRVFTQCRVNTAGPGLKDWPTAKKAVEYAFDNNQMVSLVTYSPEEKQACRPDMAHIHIKNPPDYDLNRLYNAAGLYLMSSKHEGFCLPAAEAMAVGIPVVATDAGGNMEFCIHGKTALVSGVGDYKSLANNILFLFGNRGYADELAKNGNKFIRRYSWDKSIDTLEAEFTGCPVVEDIQEPEPDLIKPASRSIEYPDLGLGKVPLPVDVQVVIPTVNDCEKTIKCLNSWKRNAGVSHWIRVLDDGSDDNDTRLKLDNYCANVPDCEFHSLRQNLGFSATVNRGMMYSLGKYIILCNNDVEILPGTVKAMIKAAESKPDVGVVGAKLLYPNGNVQFGGVHKLPNLIDFVHVRVADKSIPDVCAVKDSWVVTGALFLITRKAAAKLGGFSTGYQLAYEDVDYCLHAWTNGFRVVYCGEAEAIHHEGLTRGTNHDNKALRPLLWQQREESGRDYLLRKWGYLSAIPDLDTFKRNCGFKD